MPTTSILPTRTRRGRGKLKLQFVVLTLELGEVGTGEHRRLDVSYV